MTDTIELIELNNIMTKEEIAKAQDQDELVQ